MFALCTSSAIARAERPFQHPGALVISSSTYDSSQGAVASLTVGTPLSNTATATIPAIAGNDYVNVWNNAAVDGSFGVTSAIELMELEPHSGHVFHRLAVPPDEVATSFSSKSELGLHITKTVTAHISCSSVMRAPESERSTCRTPTRLRGRTRRTQSPLRSVRNTRSRARSYP
jgi:hypothetical protein